MQVLFCIHVTHPSVDFCPHQEVVCCLSFSLAGLIHLCFPLGSSGILGMLFGPWTPRVVSWCLCTSVSTNQHESVVFISMRLIWSLASQILHYTRQWSHTRSPASNGEQGRVLSKVVDMSVQTHLWISMCVLAKLGIDKHLFHVTWGLHWNDPFLIYLVLTYVDLTTFKLPAWLLQHI